jgi:RNA polymerase sigma-70 factor, ECF subfamily
VYTIAGPERGIFVQDHFGNQILGLLPKLRVQALALTRNRGAADDLVHDTIVGALAARDSFEPGTNFAAWMRTILRNRFIAQLRKRREMVDIDDVPASFLAVADGQESRLVLKELDRAMGRLPPKMREALVMVVALGMSYEAVAAAMNSTLGTAKSRVFRARLTLWRMLLGEEEVRASRRASRRACRSSESLLATHAGL